LAGVELIFTRSWEQTQPGQLIQTSQSDIQYNMMSCSVYKLWKLAGEQGLLLENGLGIGFQVVRNCTVHHSLCIFFYWYYCYHFSIPLLSY